MLTPRSLPRLAPVPPRRLRPATPRLRVGRGPKRGEGRIVLRRTLVQELTRESWALSGAPEPTYTRHETPDRFVPHPRE